VSTSGKATIRVPSTAGASLSYREPEGAAVAGGAVCTGFASGPAGARRANVYCTARPLHGDDHQPPVRERPRPPSGTAPVGRSRWVTSGGVNARVRPPGPPPRRPARRRAPAA
jgi:hypothetical protein